jgi:hypothetical protein
MSAPGLLQDYLTKYTAVCDKKRIKPIESIRKNIESAVNTLLQNILIYSQTFNEFLLKGSSSELKYHRIDDNKLETILAPFPVGFRAFNWRCRIVFEDFGFEL